MPPAGSNSKLSAALQSELVRQIHISPTDHRSLHNSSTAEHRSQRKSIIQECKLIGKFPSQSDEINQNDLSNLHNKLAESRQSTATSQSNEAISRQFTATSRQCTATSQLKEAISHRSPSHQSTGTSQSNEAISQQSTATSPPTKVTVNQNLQLSDSRHLSATIHSTSPRNQIASTCQIAVKLAELVPELSAGNMPSSSISNKASTSENVATSHLRKSHSSASGMATAEEINSPNDGDDDAPLMDDFDFAFGRENEPSVVRRPHVVVPDEDPRLTARIQREVAHLMRNVHQNSLAPSASTSSSQPQKSQPDVPHRIEVPKALIEPTNSISQKIVKEISKLGDKSSSKASSRLKSISPSSKVLSRLESISPSSKATSHQKTRSNKSRSSSRGNEKTAR